MVKKRVIKHKCYCRNCNYSWDSSDTFSVCPLCGKNIVAKLCISEAEEVKDEVTN